MLPRRFRGLVAKEFLQFLRDPVMIILIFWLYTIEVVLCAYALQFDVKNIPLAVSDFDRTPSSRALISAFLVSDAFADAGAPQTRGEATNWLQSGKARAVLEIPTNFEDELRRGTAEVQLVLDGTNTNTALQARAYVQEIAARFNVEQAGVRHLEAHITEPSVRLWYNQKLTNKAFMALSMVGLAALMVGVLHPAASIVREKEAGTIEQLRVTPLGVADIFIAKTLPTFAVAFIAMFPGLLVMQWFEVPLRGSLLLFLVLTMIFLLSAIAIGVFVAALTRTLQQTLLLSFFGLVPMLFLSGTIVPVESMPHWLQILSLGSPLRHYIDVMVGIFLKGMGLSGLLPQAAALFAIGAFMYALAYLIFRRS